MKQKRRLIWLVGGCVLAAVSGGCGSSNSGYVPQTVKEPPKATVQPGQEATLFPMTEGNQWTYSVSSDMANTNKQQGHGDAEITFKITKVEETANGKLATIEMTSDGKLSDRQKWLYNDKGLYQVSSCLKDAKQVLHEYQMKPIEPAILWPADSGKTFTWSGEGPTVIGSVGKMTFDSKILPSQNVDGESGKRFAAIPVNTKGSFTTTEGKGVLETTMWFSPNIGMVRFIQQLAADDKNATQRTVAKLTFKLKAYVVK